MPRARMQPWKNERHMSTRFVTAKMGMTDRAIDVLIPEVKSSQISLRKAKIRIDIADAKIIA